MGKDRGRKCVPECLKVAVDGQWEDRSVDGIRKSSICLPLVWGQA